MMENKGKIIIQGNNKQVEIYRDEKTSRMSIPKYFGVDDSLNGKECIVIRSEGGAIIDILVDGKSLKIETTKDEKKAQEIKRVDKTIPAHKDKNKFDKRSIEKNEKYVIIKTMLPHDTRTYIGQEAKIDNFNLLLNKAAQYTKKNNSYKFEFFSVDSKTKSISLNIASKYSCSFSDDIRKRIENNVSLLEKADYTIIALKNIRTSWRLAVGIGNESVYETSMTLHHVYGIPYIPGSAIKGVVRSWIITQAFGTQNGKSDLANAEYRALENQVFCDIFGCPKEVKIEIDGKKIIKKSFYGHQGESRKGGVIFFDAFPVGNITIKPDIMNPHYQEYYSDTEGKIPPADYLNPVPIFFLTVENAEFNFYLASHKKNMALINDKKIGDKNIIEWMKDALVNHGIGAKTAVGYGYMSFT